MTRQEAIAEMQKGNWVNHRFFTLTEKVTMKDGKVMDEMGYKSNPMEWWSYRQSEAWNKGWSISN